MGVVGVVGVPGVVGVVGVVGVEVVPFSIAVATISISPFTGTVFAVAKIEMTVPPGARSGTLSHAERERERGGKRQGDESTPREFGLC